MIARHEHLILEMGMTNPDIERAIGRFWDDFEGGFAEPPGSDDGEQETPGPRIFGDQAGIGFGLAGDNLPMRMRIREKFEGMGAVGKSPGWGIKKRQSNRAFWPDTQAESGPVTAMEHWRLAWSCH